jgi:Domain of unknown function (DUF5069)
MSELNHAPDLTQRPPRSPRHRLGGFVILPRALDKGRAKLAGKLGEYHFDCPLDKRFLDFVKIEATALLEQLQAGLGDGEILVWVLANAGYKPTEWEIVQWSAFQEGRTADSVPARERTLQQLIALNKDRTDIRTSFDFLELDDYVTYGGKA